MSTDNNAWVTLQYRNPFGLAYTETVSPAYGEGNQVSFLRTPDGELVGVADEGTGERFVVTDHRESPVAVIDSAGGLDAVREYNPLGQHRRTEGGFVPVTFAGGQRAIGGNQSFDSGLVKFGARYYDPQVGIFTQMDPAGQEDNPYLYAEADPINKADPSGLSAACFGLGAAGVGHAALHSFAVGSAFGPVAGVTAGAATGLFYTAVTTFGCDG